MATNVNVSARTEWGLYWPVVIAAMAGVAMSTINSYSTGVFIQPLEEAFGWSRSQISLGPAITAPIVILLAPIMGAAIDRFGPRRIAIIGVFALFTLNIALGLVGPSIWSWWAVWTMIGFANLFILPSVWTSSISGMFTTGRGFAMAVTLCGSGIGSLITPYLVYELTTLYGWRIGYFGLAAFWGVITIPLVLFLFTSARDIERVNTAALQSPPPPAGGKKLLINPRYMRLAFAGFLVTSVVMSMIMNLVPMLSSGGLTRGQAAALAPLIGIASIIGRLTIGLLLDRVRGTIVGAVCVALPIVTSLLLIYLPSSLPAMAVAVIVLGFTLGAELDIVAYLTSRYFSTSHFGLLFGTIGGLISLAGAAAPLVMNMVYDSIGNYGPVLWAYIPMCLLSALLFLSLGAYPSTKADH